MVRVFVLSKEQNRNSFERIEIGIYRKKKIKKRERFMIYRIKKNYYIFIFRSHPARSRE
jgi:hypothetical protein